MKFSLLMMHFSPWFQNLRERGIQRRKQRTLKLFFLEGICLPRKTCSNIFFFFFSHTAWGIFSNQGSSPCPLQWVFRVLTTGPREKSHTNSFNHKTDRSEVEILSHWESQRRLQGHPGSTLRTGGA